MLVAAAFVPTPPLLVPEIAAGSAAADEPLREACRAAVSRLLTTDVHEVMVVGCAPTAGLHTGGWDWRGFGVPLPSPSPTERLPLALAIGSWLLDAVGARCPIQLHGVTDDLSAADCAALGASLVHGGGRIGLLVCGDGSACRSEKAPGFFDPAAEPWDRAALSALEAADPADLLALDEAVARQVLAVGRAPWQVLAGAAGQPAFDAAIDWADAPYGVTYIAGTWTAREGAA